MKAISINQPWAWLVVNGYKGVENRDWDTKFRGEFGVHAGKKYDDLGDEWIRETFPHIPLPSKAELQDPMNCGGIVGYAELVGVVDGEHRKYLNADDDKWFMGKFGFVLRSQRPNTITPCKGALGFFTPNFTSSYKQKTKQ